MSLCPEKAPVVWNSTPFQVRRVLDALAQESFPLLPHIIWRIIVDHCRVLQNCGFQTQFGWLRVPFYLKWSVISHVYYIGCLVVCHMFMLNGGFWVLQAYGPAHGLPLSLYQAWLRW